MPGHHTLRKRHLLSHTWSMWPLVTCSLCQRRPTLWEPAVCTCAGGFPWLSSPPPLTLPSGGVCVSGRAGPPLRFPQLWCSSPPPVAQRPVAPQAAPTPPPPVVSPGLTSGACVSAPSPHPSFSGCGVPGGGADAPCGAHSAWLISVQLLHVSQRHWGPSVSADLPVG